MSVHAWIQAQSVYDGQGADGVCRLLGTCEKIHKLCLVMKRYECSLAQVIARGALGAAEVRRISHSLCNTLDQLHSSGVVVQDIKPQNILLDSYGAPVFADFGIATVVGRTTKIMPTNMKGIGRSVHGTLTRTRTRARALTRALTHARARAHMYTCTGHLDM